MLESQDIMSWKAPTKDHWVQLTILAENEALFKQPSKATFTSNVLGVMPSKGQETAQQPLMQPSQDPWEKVPGHNVHDRAAGVLAMQPAPLHRWTSHPGRKVTTLIRGIRQHLF